MSIYTIYTNTCIHWFPHLSACLCLPLPKIHSPLRIRVLLSAGKSNYALSYCLFYYMDYMTLRGTSNVSVISVFFLDFISFRCPLCPLGSGHTEFVALRRTNWAALTSESLHCPCQVTSPQAFTMAHFLQVFVKHPVHRDYTTSLYVYSDTTIGAITVDIWNAFNQKRYVMTKIG